MDVTSLPEQLDHLSNKVEEVMQRLALSMQAQETHGEIQVELIKLLQHIMQRQDELGDKVEELLTTVTSSERGTLRGDLVGMSIALLNDSQQKNIDLAVIKQSANMSLRETTNGVFPIRVVFLVQSIPMWDALADVYDAMVADERFDPIIISIKVSTLGQGAFGGEDTVSNTFRDKGIPHLRFDMADSYDALDILKALKPAVIFRQQQWDVGVQPAFRTQELTFSRICYVPYALSLAASLGDAVVTEVSAAGFDQAFHRATWRIFCETPIIKEYFLSFAHNDPDKFVVTGFPKFDRLLKEGDDPQWPIPQGIKRNFRVVWAPHYSVGIGGLGFGVFDQIWDHMLNWARENPDIDFVLKPHPALFGQVVSAEGGSAFRKDWNALPNCTFAEEAYGQLFAASDLMICDGLSFLAEYHLFQKPLIFFDSQHHVPFNALGKLAEAACRRVTDFEELKQAVLEYKSGKTWEFAAEREILLQNIVPTRGAASQAILAAIADGIRDELS